MRTFGHSLWLCIILFMVMLTISFATSNESLITLYLWPLDHALTAPTWLIILSSFIIGGLLSITLLSAQWLAIRAKLWRLQGRINKLQVIVNNQHNIEPADKGSQVQQSEQGVSNSLLTERDLR